MHFEFDIKQDAVWTSAISITQHFYSIHSIEQIIVYNNALNEIMIMPVIKDTQRLL